MASLRHGKAAEAIESKAAQRTIAERKPKGYFRTSFSVIAETFKDIYGIQQKKATLPKQAPHLNLPDQKPSEAIPEKDEGKSHPAFRKWAGRVFKYGYWFGLSLAAAKLGKLIGQSMAFTAIIYHPFIVSTTLRIKRNLKEEKISGGKSGEHAPKVKEQATGIAKLFKTLGTAIAPDRSMQVLTFCLLEIASTPIFIGTISSVVSTAKGAVSPLLAIAGVTLGTLAGFMEELNPLRLFGNRKDIKPAESASEYVGQTYGVIESYWIWIQAARLVVAGTIATVSNQGAEGFMATYLQSMLSWFGIVVDLVLPMYIEAMKDMLRKNNRHLGLEGEK
jgi:hypothetical protein